MILVFLCILTVILLIFVLSSVKIKIDYLKVPKENNLTVTFYLYLFNKIPYLKFSKNMNTKKISEKINFPKIPNTLKLEKSYNKAIKKLKFKVENFKLLINVGFLSINTTNSIILVILSTISIVLGLLNNKKCIEYKNIKYKILPSYNKDLLEIDFNFIVNIKVFNIVYILLLLLKEKLKKHDKSVLSKRKNIKNYIQSSNGKN